MIEKILSGGGDTHHSRKYLCKVNFGPQTSLREKEVLE